MIRFLDMFAGIGGFRAGLERAGGFECVGHCEIDAHANRSYEAIPVASRVQFLWRLHKTILLSPGWTAKRICGSSGNVVF